ncbi:hypothetical protein CALVIDRAFT_568705 [Calocera viscosa TUFC12733]|uniref:Uncharacterized protein n=1 Tax=Calocera viscosa (strain TUFC12733) TaxID=1330018 RepID=A0A167GRB9_CALVF|nr:hypothetical protein CALVIDRAFT_568705 [Calocera viscosa TUFC12733]
MNRTAALFKRCDKFFSDAKQALRGYAIPTTITKVEFAQNTNFTTDQADLQTMEAVAKVAGSKLADRGAVQAVIRQAPHRAPGSDDDTLNWMTIDYKQGDGEHLTTKHVGANGNFISSNPKK